QDGSIPNGYTNKSVSTRVGVNPTDNSSLEVNFRYENDRSSLDNYGANGPEDTRNYNQNHESYLVSTTGKIFLWEKYQQSLSFSFVDDDLKATDPVTAYNNYYIRTTSQQIDWQHILDLKPLTITGGLSYRYDSANNQGSFSNSFDNRAVYLNAKYMLFNDDLVLNAGGRYDHYSAFGDAFTYRAGLLYNFKPFEMRFKANVGSGFRAPAMNELYYPYYGNANLKPEKSTTYDIGVEKDLFKKKLVLGATWFSQYYRNLIQTNYVTYMAGNIGKARINGVELKATAKVIDNLNLNVSYTWLDAIDRDTGAFLPSRPRSKFTSSVDYTIEKLNLMAEYIYVSKRFDSSLGKNLGGYSLINLNASYELHKNIAIYIRIANLLNKSYSEIAGYGTPGISVYGGVKVNI
ncbi:MAG: TonB-dependent receptor, partial [Desulfuromonadales bacterium]|nr:TonB-dependent receptor [Desulfuromonadales bacterium]